MIRTLAFVGALMMVAVVLTNVESGYPAPGPWGPAEVTGGDADVLRYRTRAVIPHGYVDITTGTHTDLNGAMDAYAFPKALNLVTPGEPTFEFNFYGNVYDRFHAHANGFISFDRGGTDDSDLTPTSTGVLDEPKDYMPNTDGSAPAAGFHSDLPETMIAPFWMDIDPFRCSGVEPNPGMYAALSGTYPARTLTIQWTDVAAEEDPRTCLGGATRQTFQIRLHEATSNIDFVYEQALARYFATKGSAALVGIHSQVPGDDQLSLVYGTYDGASPTTNLNFNLQAIRFFPNHAPSAETPAQSVYEDGFVDFVLSTQDSDWDPIVDYDLDATALTLGSIVCNEPLEPYKCRYTGFPNVYGLDTATLKVTDSMGTESEQAEILFSVLPVNDRPSIDQPPDVTVLQLEKTWTFPVGPGPFITGFNPGPNEDTQVIAEYIVAVDHPEYFITQPTIDSASGKLYFATRASANGVAEVTLRVRDNGGSNGIDTSLPLKFDIIITAFENTAPTVVVNEQPSIVQAEHLVLTHAHLDAYDELGDDQITYRVIQPPQRGALWIDGIPMKSGDTFLDTDIESGRIIYQHHGLDAVQDGFTFSLHDSFGASSGVATPWEWTIRFLPQANPGPAAYALRPMLVVRGETILIDTLHMEFRDAAVSPVDLEINLVAPPAFGEIRKNGAVASKWSQFDVNKGRIAYVHNGLDLTPEVLRVQAEDATGKRTSARDFVIYVVDPNAPPTLATIADETLQAGDLWRILLLGEDPEGKPFEVCLVDGPAGMQLNADGVLQWQPSAFQEGPNKVTVCVRELADPTKTEQVTFTLTVKVPLGLTETLSDADGDGVPDQIDNCPAIPNPEQNDLDGDRLGEATCDLIDPSKAPPDGTQGNLRVDPTARDLDADLVMDDVDNCPGVHNPVVQGDVQPDLDGDGHGDACDPDVDGDAIGESGLAPDNCPRHANFDQADLDEDKIGDVCDPDADGDGIDDGRDNCLRLYNDQADSDGDGRGDACDNCPGHRNHPQVDTDGDGIGDVCDPRPGSVEQGITTTTPSAAILLVGLALLFIARRR